MPAHNRDVQTCHLEIDRVSNKCTNIAPMAHLSHAMHLHCPRVIVVKNAFGLLWFRADTRGRGAMLPHPLSSSSHVSFIDRRMGKGRRPSGLEREREDLEDAALEADDEKPILEESKRSYLLGTAAFTFAL